MLRRSVLVAAVLLVASCGDPDPPKGPTNIGGSKPDQDDGKAAEPARAPEDGAAGEDDEGTAGKAEEGKADAAAAGEEANADEGKAEEGKADEAAADGEAEEGKADEGKAEEGKADEGEPPADPKALLKEARKKKTTDERALEALTQAEEAGAKVRDLAKAANARGLALHATPERAAKFFEWAADKDKKYPDPMFNLAKQAVNTGDVDKAKGLLKQVHERKGKKLLSQLEFDPMWEIVKDDPEVKELYR